MDQRVAIVTGASRGIGAAVSHRLAQDGHMPVLVSRSIDTLEEVRQSIADQGHAAEVRSCDVGDGEALSAVVEEVASTHGRLDILVNNAGINRDGLLLRMSDEDFDTVLGVNLKAAFVACRAAVRPMMRNRFGRIVNMGSVIGLIGNPGQCNYAASKAGLIGMTRSIAKEMGPKGITANVVAPGYVETGMLQEIPSERIEGVLKMLPLRRLGKPEEVAHLVSYLVSDLAEYMTGQVLTLDGGMTC